MHSCIFRILFQMNEISCMNIRGILYHPVEMWGNLWNCRKKMKFLSCL